jgi:hypothetical protein
VKVRAVMVWSLVGASLAMSCGGAASAPRATPTAESHIHSWLHVPLDSTVLKGAQEVCGELRVGRLKGMTEDEYLNIQGTLRECAHSLNRPAIWFEDAYATPEPPSHVAKR